MQRKLFSKNAFLLAFLAVFLLMSTGCDKAKSSSAVNDLIDSEVTATVTAINERDVKLARNIWSDLSELSVSLQKQDEDDLSADVAALALSYEDLIADCGSGNEKDLSSFKASFQTAAENLAPSLSEAGYDCRSLSESLASVYQ